MTEIPGLPKPLRRVPERNPEYAAWREKVTLYRTGMRRMIESDMGARQEVVALASDDPAYDALMFGATFEPRDRPARKHGWHPMIPFAYQVRMWRFIDEVNSVMVGSYEASMGRGDAIMEKARTIGGTTTYGSYAAWKWKFDDGWVTTFMSYKNDVVEKTGETGTIFHKIEGYLGLDLRVPEIAIMNLDGITEGVPLRSPSWMVPEGFNPKEHDNLLALAHPYKTNVITGTATTKKSGTGARVSMWVIDEASKFPQMRSAWENLSPVTDHRHAVSSADRRFGNAFEQLARLAEYATKHDTEGPSFMQVRIDENPEHDEEFVDAMKSRHVGITGAEAAYDREYGIDYESGSGLRIYPGAKLIEPKPLDFNPSFEHLDLSIDPAVSRDECCIHVWKYTPHTARYGLLLSYANSGKPADFYASLLVAKPYAHAYNYGEMEERFMEFMEAYGQRVRRFVGDPAGKAKITGEQGKLRSFYDDIYRITGELTDGRRSMYIFSSDKPEFKNLKPRWDALRWLLQRLDVNNEPDTIMTLNAIQAYHLKSADEDRETVILPENPVRSAGRDRVTSAEYYAADRKTDHGVATAGVKPATRQSRSGGPLKKSPGGTRIG